MSVELIHYQHHPLGRAIAPLQQRADAHGPVGSAATLRHLNMAPSGQRLARQEQVGRAVADVLVRLAIGFPLGPPGLAGLGDGLKRSSLIGAPDRKPQSLAKSIGVLNQIFFSPRRRGR